MSQTNINLSNSAASLAKNKLLMDCYRHMQSNDLVLPTIPDVAFKIRRAINDDNTSTSAIARIIQTDPAITAKLIQISNSPLYMGRKKTESCPEALTRIGLKTSQDIVTSFAIKSVFNAKSPVIRHKMAELWAHSSYIASISAVFAHKIPGFDPDRAMLAGLIHDIGIVPILTYADNHPDILDHPKDLLETVRLLRTDIGVQIIRHWDFPEDFEDVVINAENWFRNENSPPNYADIVMISQLHSFIGKVDIRKIPKIDDLPAYKKLAGHLNANDSINILDAAKDEIEQIRQMLA
jgi:HD-like signal output (HDOD) protein